VLQFHRARSPVPTVVDGDGGSGGSGGRRSPDVFVSKEESAESEDSSLIPGQVEAGFMGNLFG